MGELLFLNDFRERRVRAIHFIGPAIVGPDDDGVMSPRMVVRYAEPAPAELAAKAVTEVMERGGVFAGDGYLILWPSLVIRFEWEP